MKRTDVVLYLVAGFAVATALSNRSQWQHIEELETRIERLESTRKADLTIFDRSTQE